MGLRSYCKPPAEDDLKRLIDSRSHKSITKQEGDTIMSRRNQAHKDFLAGYDADYYETFLS